MWSYVTCLNIKTCFDVPQAPLKVILQRAPDGTPLQWFEEEDAEIVSQV